MSLYELNQDNFTEMIIGDSPVLVKYYIDGCGPCKMMETIINNLASTTAGVAFFGVSADKSPSLTAAAKITGVPTMILYKSGKEVARLVGYQGEDLMRNFLNVNI